MEHIGSSSNAPQNHSSDSDDANNAMFTEGPSQAKDTSEFMKEMFVPSKDEARYIRKTSAGKKALESIVLFPDAADIESSEWKLAECRKKMVTEMVENCIRERPYLSGDICGLTKSMERCEAEVFFSAKDKIEYLEMISVKKIEVQPCAERSYSLYPSPPDDYYDY